ncbi:TolC family protein [Chryseolinea sp. T2]|uniref:TolC family protein n=1 Tax=Chryseolinea sp. T2 TaxID=3129255 RepID=UPI003077521B
MKRSLIVSILAIFCISTSVKAQTTVVSLEEVIALAIEQNYDVRVASTLSHSAQVDDKFSVGAFFPVINATGSRTWNVNNQRQILRNDSLVERNGVRTNNIAAALQANWLVFDGGRMFATRERLDQLAQQGVINVKDQMVQTISQVVLNYFNIVRQKQQLTAIRELVVLGEERVRLADRRLAVGTGAKPELLQAKVDLNAQRTAAITQETTIAQLKDQLSGLVNKRLPVVYDVADTIIIDLDISQEDVQSKTETSNYTLQSFKKGVDIASLSVRERRGETYPFISLIGAYNFSRTENEVVINNFTPLFNRNSGFNYGLTASFPIMNGFLNRRNIAQARINLDRSKLLYEQTKINIDVAIRNAYVAYENAKKVLLIEEETIGLAKENIYIALESFKRSANTFIEVRTAQQSLADAYNRLINARYVAKVAETELLRLSGQLLQEK